LTLQLNSRTQRTQRIREGRKKCQKYYENKSVLRLLDMAAKKSSSILNSFASFASFAFFCVLCVRLFGFQTDLTNPS